MLGEIENSMKNAGLIRKNNRMGNIRLARRNNSMGNARLKHRKCGIEDDGAKRGQWKKIWQDSVSRRECILTATQTFFVTLLFYKSVGWVIGVGIPVCILQLWSRKKEWMERRRWMMNLEFREGLQGIAAALNAGYSVENALEESSRDLQVLYGESSVLYPEFMAMLARIRLNQPVVEVFDEFAASSGVEDIRSFAEVFRTAQKSGGDLVAIIRTSAGRIGEKIEIRREIQTMIAAKQFEGRIMNMVPLGMILYFWICSPGFLDCLYQTLSGRMIMTCFLGIYLVSGALSRRICHIAV